MLNAEDPSTFSVSGVFGLEPSAGSGADSSGLAPHRRQSLIA
jgi:hypothetical protein